LVLRRAMLMQGCASASLPRGAGDRPARVDRALFAPSQQRLPRHNASWAARSGRSRRFLRLRTAIPARATGKRRKSA